mmetsp:Transcript_33004/g.38737  ORF Transcript_33004/g.38737 Transcript_33004/m.38737 type:complete len:150 (-) Transcript_33004:110-559(-)
MSSQEEMDELREMFKIVDRDDGGTISKEELTYLMETLGIHATPEDINVMISELDNDGDGTIDFEEFIQVIQKKVAASFTLDQVKSAFKVFEGSSPEGTIHKDDLILAMMTHGTTKLTEEEAINLITQLEPNSEGQIDYDTYVEMMMSDN